MTSSSSLSLSRKRSVDAKNNFSQPLNKRRRLTRSVFGSAVDIPIVLSDSESNSNSDSDSDSISSSTSKIFKKNDTLDQVITNGRIIRKSIVSAKSSNSSIKPTKTNPKKNIAGSKKVENTIKNVENPINKISKIVETPKKVEKNQNFEIPKNFENSQKFEKSKKLKISKKVDDDIPKKFEIPKKIESPKKVEIPKSVESPKKVEIPKKVESPESLKKVETPKKLAISNEITNKEIETPTKTGVPKIVASPIKPKMKIENASKANTKIIEKHVNLKSIVKKVDEKVKFANSSKFSESSKSRDNLNKVKSSKVDETESLKKPLNDVKLQSLKSALKSLSPPSHISTTTKKVTINENPITSVMTLPYSSPAQQSFIKSKVSSINNKENSNPNDKKADLNNNKKGSSDKAGGVPSFDPKTQKSYRDIYSICCISCQKKNRSEYCNRQKPCDICVGKKLKNCSYSSDAKIVIPARFVKKTGSRSSKYQLNYSVFSNKNLDDLANTDESSSDSLSRFGKSKRSRSVSPRFEKDSIENKVNLITNAKEDSFHKNSDSDSSESCIKVNRKRKSSLKILKENIKQKDRDRLKKDETSKKKYKISSGSYSDDDSDILAGSEDLNQNSDADDDGGDESEFDEFVSNDGNDFIDDADADDDDDDYYYDSAYVRGRHSSKVSSKEDNFERAQRILKTLEFEKRDINDLYVQNSRQRREATKENYYIPSDGDDDPDDPELNGYAAAEARNEQIILSEDEQERRMLRGEMDAEYIKSLHREMEKRRMVESSDSLSSDDDF